MSGSGLVKWILTGHAGGRDIAALAGDFGRAISRSGAIRHGTVHVEAGRVVGPNGQRNTDGIDAMAELWIEGDAVPEVANLPLGPAQAWEVTEIGEKGPMRLDPGPVPGVTVLARLPAKPGLAQGEVLAGYALHAPLALRVHGAMDRYVRHVAAEYRAGRPSRWFGFSLLHYATDGDRRDRHYDSPQGRQAILDDQAGFLDVGALQVMERQKLDGALADSFTGGGLLGLFR